MGRTRTNRLTFFPQEGADGLIYKPGDLVKIIISEIIEITNIPKIGNIIYNN